MKRRLLFRKVFEAGLVLGLLFLLAMPHPSFGQGTAFVYSGVLNDSGTPASGIYDLTFALSTDRASLSQVGTTLTNLAVPVTNGVFIVTLDYGAGVFMGEPLWLEIGVRTNGATDFSVLTPLQPVEATPYAIMAGTASNLLGTVQVSQLSGSLTTAQLPAIVLTNMEAAVALEGSFSGDAEALTNYQQTNLVASVSTNSPISTGTNFSLDFAFTKVIWTLATNACISNTLNAGAGDNHMEVWIRTASSFTISWLPNVNLVGTLTTNGLQITNSQGYWVMAVSQYGTNWNANTCTYAIVPPNR